MSINSQLTDYSLLNSNLYTPTFLSKRAYKLFLTIPHTDIDKDDLLNLFSNYKQVIYCKICQEHHEDGDTHLHVILCFKAQTRYKSIQDILIQASKGKRIVGCVNYEVPKSIDAVSKYLDKEGNVCEYGEKPSIIGKIQTGESGLLRSERGYKEAVISAQQGNLEEAKQILLDNQTRDMLINGTNILDNLKSLDKTRKRFNVPCYTSDNTNLRDWQKKLLSLVTEAPKERRIIWVHGEPETGKSFMFNYLSNLDNYEYGIYNAGQCVSMDNLVYGYDEEGIIAWDFPMNFQFQTDNNNLQGHIANVIEKFSDFGQTVSSKKYKGSTKVIRGHCVVFSNRVPLEELAHRDIVVIHAKKEQIWFPFSKQQTSKKINKSIETIETNEKTPESTCVSVETNETQPISVRLIETEASNDYSESLKHVRHSLFNPPPDKCQYDIKKIQALRRWLERLRNEDIQHQLQKEIAERILELESKEL